MKLIPRGGTWQVHFQDMTGTRQRLSTGVKVDPALPDKGKALANLAAIDKMRESLMGEVPPELRTEAGKQRTLAYALQRTLDEHWEKLKGARSYRYRVAGIIKDVGYWRLGHITYTMLSDYAAELAKKGNAPATINRKLSAIHTAMERAMLRGEMGDSPLPKFPNFAENNVKERYLSREEEAALLANMAESTAPGDEQGQYLMAAIPLLLDTGIRAGELMVTREQDLQDRLWLPHGTTKNNRGRTVPLTSRAREALDKILASPYHWELVDLAGKDKSLPSGRLGAGFKRAVKRAGIKGVTLHTLRHTCASRLVQAGVPLYTVKEWLGHSSITVTERYAHLAPGNLDAGLAALEAALGNPAETGRVTSGAPKASVH